MPIPSYSKLMLPFLQLLADEKNYQTKEIIERLAENFNLSEGDKKEAFAGGERVFNNRVGWARTYLKKAGLITSPSRGILTITQRGKEFLKTNPKELTNDRLKQYPEFREFVQLKKLGNEEESEVSSVQEESTTYGKTPEEIIEDSYLNIKQSLVQDILDKTRALEPAAFEKLVVELLVKMGYGGSIKDAGKAIGKTNDEGIDGTIKEDKLGLDIIYIQAKRWKADNVVGRPELHKFVGALAGQGAKKGVFLTTSFFTKEARSYSPKNETKIVLIDGFELAQLMIDYNLGVSTQRIYEIKKLDNDYFEEI